MTNFSDIRLDWLFDNFKQKKIIVLGDLMLDRYVWGTVNRISPEAPVPIVEEIKQSICLGGAANVASNLYSLGAIPIPVGVIGDDSEGECLLKLMKSYKFVTDSIIVDNTRPTAIKTRIIANDQHVVRTDRESKEPINEKIINKIIKVIEDHIEDADAIIIEDYNKGLLVQDLIKRVISLARKNNVIITVDPKFNNFFEYKSVTLFKPNRKEIESAFGIKINSEHELESASKRLLDSLKCDAVLITLGEQGMFLRKSNGEINMIPTRARKVHDVSGAGDTVISTLTLALTTGADLNESMTLANYAAGAVCEELGAIPIEPSKLRATIQHFK